MPEALSQNRRRRARIGQTREWGDCAQAERNGAEEPREPSSLPGPDVAEKAKKNDLANSVDGAKDPARGDATNRRRELPMTERP